MKVLLSINMYRKLAGCTAYFTNRFELPKYNQRMPFAAEEISTI